MCVGEFGRVAVAVVSRARIRSSLSVQDGLMLFRVTSKERTSKLLNQLTFGVMGLVTIVPVVDSFRYGGVGRATFGTALGLCVRLSCS
jgi:hypothetical protein